jgi:hypothetical protein
MLLESKYKIAEVELCESVKMMNYNNREESSPNNHVKIATFG